LEQVADPNLKYLIFGYNLIDIETLSVETLLLRIFEQYSVDLDCFNDLNEEKIDFQNST